MVDINLFKDEEEEEWKSDSGGKKEGESGDELIKEFGMDENLAGSSALSDEDLLSNEENMSDLEEPDDKDVGSDYQFGNTKKRKTSPGVWVALGIVLVFAAFYFFYYQPKQTQIKNMASNIIRRPQVNEQEDTLSQGRIPEPIGVSTDSGSAESSVSRVSGGVVGSSLLNELASVGTVVDAGIAVFQNLTQEGQLGTIIFDGYNFHVGYVSETPGVAQAMGYRIQTVLGTSGFEVSPEDQHRTAGRVHYWGVVSGVLPKKEGEATQIITGTRFTTPDNFIQEVKVLVQNNRLSVRETETFFMRSEGGYNQTPVRLKIEGTKVQTLTFLNILKGFQGNYRLAKITIAPVDISDFNANQVKLVLEFVVFIA